MTSQNPESSAPARRLSLITRKILVTAAVGTLAYFLTERAIGDDGPWAITGSIFLGGVAFVAQFLIDIESRMDKLEAAQVRHQDSIDTSIRDSFRSIGQATELHGMVSESKISNKEVASLLRSAVSITTKAPTLAAKLAQSELRRLQVSFDQLSRNQEATQEGEDRDWLLNLARHSEGSIMATSSSLVDAGAKDFLDGGLWQSDLGMRYLELQSEAIKRGVHIKRIFITDLPSLPLEDQFAHMCALHRKLGVDVRVYHPNSMSGIESSSLHDFIIFDESIVYETTPASRVTPSNTSIILNTRLMLQPQIVSDRIKHFERLWELAEKVG